MKKIIAVLFSIFIILTCLLPAYASGDVHVADSYNHQTENMHTYRCTICNVTITEYHDFDINGNCDCGYFIHSHRIGTYKYYNENMHTYECKDCGVLISEYHNFDSNGSCDCGYFHHPQEPVSEYSFCELLLSFLMWIFNFIISLF